MPPPPSFPPRIGVFGGTFDPPHVGHLVTAINVAHALDLDSVLMMVNNVPWQKIGQRQVTPAEDRLAMVAAAVADNPLLEVGTQEIEAGGKSYTADTLATLRSEYPQAEFFVILGDDAAAGIHTWERSQEVIDGATLVVVDRPGDPVELDPDIAWQRVEVPRLEVSSSDLRSRCSDGRPLDYLITDDVLAVIYERGLYGVAHTPSPEKLDAEDPVGDSVGRCAPTAVGDADLTSTNNAHTGTTHRN